MGCELLASRYDQLAEALGGHGELVRRADELEPALARARCAAGRPAVVNVAIEGAGRADLQWRRPLSVDGAVIERPGARAGLLSWWRSLAEAMTGRSGRRLPPAARAAYVDGVIDAWVGLVLVQESLGNKDAGITVFAEVVTCLRDRLVGHDKIFAAVEKYVEDQPGLRTKDMPDIVFVALGPFCRSGVPPPRTVGGIAAVSGPSAMIDW